MRLISNASLFLGTCLLLLLSGCGGGPKGVTITEGDTQIGAARLGTIVRSTRSTVVHVDIFERIVTIRNGKTLPAGFLIATDSSGKQTAALKAHSTRPDRLRTADILEGEPGINDTIAPASTAEKSRLEKIYRDAEGE